MSPDEVAKEIFDDLDELMETCLSNKPKPLNNSLFLREYKKLKESYLGVQYVTKQ